MSISGMKIKKM